MKIEIKNKKENPLLARIEVSGIVAFEGATPSNEQVAQSIASQLKVDASVVKMKKIYTTMGSREAEFLAFVYNSKEELDKIEPKPKKQLEKEKKAAEDAKKAAEAPKEEAKPAEAKPEEKKEAPKEEKKEEAKPEEKKEAPKEEKKEGAE
jgi:ribosomal protein S24E